MRRYLRSRLAVMAALALAMTGLGAVVEAGVAQQRIQPITIDAARVRQLETLSTARARQVEAQVSQLPASTAVTVPDGAATRPPSEQRPGSLTAETGRAPPPPNQLQFVRTTPQLEREIASAIATRPGIREIIAGGGTLHAFPGVLRQSDEAAQPVQLKAYALVGRPLRFDPASGLYDGEIRLGVTEIAPGPRRRLGTPISFEVIGAHDAQPELARIEETSPPHPRMRIQMATAGRILVASDLIPEGIALDMPLAPTLSVVPGSGSIEGWGLGKTDLNISATGLDPESPRVVDLNASSGFLDRTRVTLDADGHAAVSIRSDRLGTARITATMPGYNRAPAEIDFRFPYITLLSGLLGGLVGAGIRVLRSDLAAGRLAMRLLGGVLVGALIFALYAIGVNVLTIEPTVTVGAVFVFAISGLGAFVGSRPLEAATSAIPSSRTAGG